MLVKANDDEVVVNLYWWFRTVLNGVITSAVVNALTPRLAFSVTGFGVIENDEVDARSLWPSPRAAA